MSIEFNSRCFVANPSDLDWNDTLWRFGFGVYGNATIFVWAKGVEDALEIAAESLKETFPGLLCADDEIAELYKTALAELVASGHDPEDEDTMCQAQENATVDLTYTESGYIASYEWTVDEVFETYPEYAAVRQECETLNAESDVEVA